MPYKHNADRRHHIAKMNFRVTNWPEYEAGLRRRGSLKLWMTPEALAGWHAPRRKTRGGQPRYSDLAIETALTLGCVFGMRLRQTEGLMNSVFDLMGLEISLAVSAKFLRPKSHGLVRDDDARSCQHILDRPQVERKPEIELNGMGNHLRRKSVATIKRITGKSGHAARSHIFDRCPVDVTVPQGRFSFRPMYGPCSL
ncbi:hypothetical protein FHS25_007205 [Rhizobium laguerreae]|uniref:Transposase DDE domain-containing protein n=1 Tax=Rhizobium laguerreae TaxID=1076926 RepID=A0ABR6GK58_9HYPH|nr:hypothetical protein [Rhizobium laguerreae]